MRKASSFRALQGIKLFSVVYFCNLHHKNKKMVSQYNPSIVAQVGKTSFRNDKTVETTQYDLILNLKIKATFCSTRLNKK